MIYNAVLAATSRFLACVLCVIVPIVVFAEDTGYKVTYDGGSIPAVKPGTGLKLYLDANQIRFVKDKEEVITVPASAVTEISYGQDVHRRVGTAVAVGVSTLGLGALTALSKSKKHFVGLTWANGDQKGGLAVQCDKSDYRGVLAGLEGITGKEGCRFHDFDGKELGSNYKSKRPRIIPARIASTWSCVASARSTHSPHISRCSSSAVSSDPSGIMPR